MGKKVENKKGSEKDALNDINSNNFNDPDNYKWSDDNYKCWAKIWKDNGLRVTKGREFGTWGSLKSLLISKKLLSKK